MIDLNRSKFPSRYEVRIGHSRVTVDGFDRADAIRQARQQLGLEMPRLYDVIASMDEGCFEVIQVDRDKKLD